MLLTAVPATYSSSDTRRLSRAQTRWWWTTGFAQRKFLHNNRWHRPENCL